MIITRRESLQADCCLPCETHRIIEIIGSHEFGERMLASPIEVSTEDHIPPETKPRK